MNIRLFSAMTAASGCEFKIHDHQLLVKSSKPLLINGVPGRTEEFIALQEGDTLKCGDDYYARLRGEMKKVPLMPSHAKKFGRDGGYCDVFDHGDGENITLKIKPEIVDSKREESIKKMELEQKILAAIDWLGELDQEPILKNFVPQIRGRTAPDELVLENLEGSPLIAQDMIDGGLSLLNNQLTVLYQYGIDPGDFLHNMTAKNEKIRLFGLRNARLGIREMTFVPLFYENGPLKGLMELVGPTAFTSNKKLFPDTIPFVPKTP